jgi:hypothetical protein
MLVTLSVAIWPSNIAADNTALVFESKARAMSWAALEMTSESCWIVLSNCSLLTGRSFQVDILGQPLLCGFLTEIASGACQVLGKSFMMGTVASDINTTTGGTDKPVSHPTPSVTTTEGVST